MSRSCGSCGAETTREPLCEGCNDEEVADGERLRAELAKESAEHTDTRLDLISARRTAGDCREAYDRLRAELARRNEAARNLEAEIDRLRAELVKAKASLTRVVKILDECVAALEGKS